MARKRLENQTKTVLLIEDDETLAQMYKLKFETAGYQIVIAHNGQEGLEFLKGKPVDVVVLDILLPRYNGFQVIKEIRKSKTMVEIPVIILTNLIEADVNMSGELATSLGVVDYLVKSKVTPDEVVARVNAAAARKKTA